MHNNKLIVPLAGLLLFASGTATAAPRTSADIVDTSLSQPTFETFRSACYKDGGTINVVRYENSPRPGRPPPVNQRNSKSGDATDTQPSRKVNTKNVHHLPPPPGRVVDPNLSSPTFPEPPPELLRVRGEPTLFAKCNNRGGDAVGPDTFWIFPGDCYQKLPMDTTGATLELMEECDSDYQ